MLLARGLTLRVRVDLRYAVGIDEPAFFRVYSLSAHAANSNLRHAASGRVSSTLFQKSARPHMRRSSRRRQRRQLRVQRITSKACPVASNLGTSPSAQTRCRRNHENRSSGIARQKPQPKIASRATATNAASVSKPEPRSRVNQKSAINTPVTRSPFGRNSIRQGYRKVLPPGRSASGSGKFAPVCTRACVTT
jgi:hypothetical protein